MAIRNRNIKLLDTNGGNTKVKKTADFRSKKVIDRVGDNIRLASLSLHPTDVICPSRQIAGCAESCLVSAGMGRFKNVKIGRMFKSQLYLNDRAFFLQILGRELFNFDKLCKKTGIKGIVRLNTISDISYEDHGIPQRFPDLFFYDYTKRANRLGKTPSNYKLMFSYSGAQKYQNQVSIALKTDVPVSVVFNGDMPKAFLNRRVIDGDVSDLENLFSGRVVIGLKAKGLAKETTSDFVVNTNIIARAS
jgi:hypothetical protein